MLALEGLLLISLGVWKFERLRQFLQPSTAQPDHDNEKKSITSPALCRIECFGRFSQKSAAKHDHEDDEETMASLVLCSGVAPSIAQPNIAWPIPQRAKTGVV